MKKRILSIFLAATMLISVFAFAADAEGNDTLGAEAPTIEQLRAAFDTVNTAVKNMESLIGSDQVSTLTSIFNGVVDFSRIATPLFGTINGGMTFLKLVGLVKDENAEKLADIMHELNIVSEKISEMDKKLDNITDMITKLDADNKYNARFSRASSLKDNWRSFRLEYMEKTLDKMMTEYNAMILNGLKTWFVNSAPNSRKDGGVDNSSITVIYLTDEEGKETLYLTDGDAPDGEIYTCYTISEGELPESLSWNADTCEKTLTDALRPIFTEKYGFDAEKAEKVASDAYKTLVSRIAAKEINKDANFSLELADAFRNYCSRLFESEYGIDAYIKALYLTHAFEYEVSEEINGVCDRMILSTAAYGSFVTGVLGMSDFVSESSYNASMSSLTAAINAIENARQTSLTGKPSYCYITSCELLYTYDVISMSGVYQVRTKPAIDDPTTSTYLNGKLNGTAVYPAMNGKTDAGLVGDSNAALILLTLRANGVDPTHAYFSEKLGNGKVKDYGSVMTSRGQQTTLGFGDSVKMSAYNVIGNYFIGKDNGKLNFNSLPSKCEDDEFDYRVKITGSVLDLASGQIASGRILAAFAGYSEHHWYWYHDETAFMCGPYTDNGSVDFELSESKEYYGAGKIGYDRTYTMDADVYYNTLHCIKGQESLSAGGYDPISALNGLNAELGAEKPELEPANLGEEIVQEGNDGENGKLTYVLIPAAVIVVAAVAAATVIAIRKKKK